MHNKLIKLKVEHAQIKGILQMIESFLNGMPPLTYAKAVLKRFYHIWNKHEKEEELILRKDANFPEETMFLEEHRTLRGHWKVIQLALDSGNREKLMVALDTDGRMLLEKFYRHINAEERYLDNLLRA